MAATVSPWAKPGAWALDAEEHEAELLQQPQPTPNISAAPLANDFPSLSTAAATKQKKKKNQTLSLAEFSSLGSAKPAQPTPPPVGRTHEDLLMLPTGPRERSAEELDRSRLGGGFKNYGSNSRYGGSGDDSSNSRWGSSRGEGDSRRNRDSSREIAPSRADETDNWAAAKKSVVTGNGFERRERGERERERGGFFDSQSKADEVDSWVANKSFTPSEGRRFGGGFERRGSFDSLSNGNGGGSGGADSDSWGKKRSEESSGGSGGMRPRLVLQPRTIPVAKEGGVVAKAKGSNPFGEARPREQVLAEQGKDLKEIEDKFEVVKIIKEEKVEGKRGFGKSWSDNKSERAWRKPDSPTSTLPESAEKNEYGHAEENENGHDEEN